MAGTLRLKGATSGYVEFTAPDSGANTTVNAGLLVYKDSENGTITGTSTNDITEGSNLYYTTARFDSDFATKDLHDSVAVQAQIDATIASTDTHDSAKVQGQFDSAFPSAFDTRFALQDTHDSVAVQAQIDSAAVWSESGVDISYSLGNVGIGETSPEGILHLKTATGDANLIIEADPTNTDDADTPYITFRADGSSATSAMVGLAGGNDNFVSGVLANALVVRATGTRDTQFVNADSVSMTITDSGNVGIGTTSPTSSLQVVGEVDDTPSSEGVHMGMTANYANIQLAGTNGGFIDFTSADGGNFDGRIIYRGSPGDLEFYTNGTERMRLLNSGRFFCNESPGTTMGGFGTEANAGLSVYPDAGFTVIQADTTNTALYVTKTSTASGQYVNFATNGTTRGAITETGSNIGIQFGSTAGAAHTLDDYEEGTWTPAYGAISGSFSSVTYANQIGHYTKVGNMVTVQGRIDTSAMSIGSAATNLLVTGLPYSAHSGAYQSGAISYSWGFSSIFPTAVSFQAGGTSLYLFSVDRANATSSVVPSNLGTGTTYLYFGITYIAA